jgi:hypothetical protein
MIASAHRHGALTLVDGAQSVSHRRTETGLTSSIYLIDCKSTRNSACI